MSSSRAPYGASGDALIDAAIRLVAREGLAGLSGRALAREAGVSHSGLHYHFDSMDALLAAALDRAFSQSVQLLEEPATLPDLFRFMLDEVERQDDVAAFQFEVLLAGRRQPRLRLLAERVYDRYREWLTASLERLDVSDPEATDLVLAIVDGISYQLTALGSSQLPTARAQVRAIARVVETYRRVPTTSGHA